jgi:hypothetical protein
VYERQMPKQSKKIVKKKGKSTRKRSVRQPYPPQVRRSGRINAKTKGLKVSFDLGSSSGSLEVPSQHLSHELGDLHDLNSFLGPVKFTSLQKPLDFDGSCPAINVATLQKVAIERHNVPPCGSIYGGTPLVPLINQLRASHSTLMVALLSRVVTLQTGAYGEALRKYPESLKVITRTSSG